MGRAKQEGMEHEEKVQHALGLCLEVGALQECPVHSDIYIDPLEFLDPDELCQHVTNEIQGVLDKFNGAQDLRDCLWSAMEEAGEECPICAKNMDD
jgi:hypothetical protein